MQIMVLSETSVNIKLEYYSAVAIKEAANNFTQVNLSV